MRWIAKAGLRGGILLPHVPPDCTHILPLYAPEMECTYPHSKKAMRYALHDNPEPEVRAMLGVPLAPEETPRGTATMAFMGAR